MSDHTIYLDDLSEALTLTDDGENAEWPQDVEIILDIKWHPAEPDVGINEEQGEIRSVEYWLGTNSYAEEADFIAALYLQIGEWIEEDQDALAALISRLIDEEELSQ